ncbi:MAG: hypothetical protein ACKVZ0_17005 [Gemmatimonadales bacterium]
MIPTPIQLALATLRKHGIRTLVLGGQASILHGGAEFSRDLDLLLTTDPADLVRLQGALAELEAELIAVPPLAAEYLDRGHAVHFRCRRSDVSGLRLDLLTRPPRLPDLDAVWHRAVVAEVGGETIPVVAVDDLIQTKKTQRDKDWAIIGALVRADMVRHRDEPTPDRLRFWLREAREADDLITLAAGFPEEARAVAAGRPLLHNAVVGDRSGLALELAKEQLAGKEADRRYWGPLQAELEQLRHRQRRG